MSKDVLILKENQRKESNITNINFTVIYEAYVS